jgi:hypothetical protein
MKCHSIAAIAAAAAAPVEDLFASQSASQSPSHRPVLSSPKVSILPRAGLLGFSEEQSTSSEASAPDFRIPCIVVRPPSSGRTSREIAAPSISKSRPISDVQPLPRTSSLGDDGRGILSRANFLSHVFDCFPQATASPSVKRLAHLAHLIVRAELLKLARELPGTWAM